MILWICPDISWYEVRKEDPESRGYKKCEIDDVIANEFFTAQDKLRLAEQELLAAKKKLNHNMDEYIESIRSRKNHGKEAGNTTS